MKQIVIGNDIDRIYWDIFSKTGVPEDFSDAEIVSLQAYKASTPTLKANVVYRIEPEGNRFSIVIPADNITKTGIYDLELIYTKPDLLFTGGIRTYRVTSCGAFEIVQKSCQVELPEDPTVIAGVIGPLKGYSAYEVAVKNGYEGSEVDWLESLKLHFADLEEQDIEQLQQPALVAAQVAVEAADVAYNAAEAADLAADTVIAAKDNAQAQASYAKEQGDFAKQQGEILVALEPIFAKVYSEVEYNDI